MRPNSRCGNDAATLSSGNALSAWRAEKRRFGHPRLLISTWT
jgi:hypothetical protein